ncbi:MAG: cysteine synthase A [Candidatus Gastranaerophilales bacterium]|nr:cysteine synthase A [bacterium]MBQ8848497.1 cysteine synthase A [Candidatus Gastranaerophilales bacterium]
MNIKENILETIGNTPLVKINNLNNGYANIYAKIEFFNPAGSIKDRVAYNMLENALNQGKINKDTTIIEPTSGNTGIGLALVCAVLGYKLILTMPENMSEERKKILSNYGAELFLTKKELGMQGAINKAFELNKEIKNSFIPQQFENPDNPMTHYNTTANEIFNDTDGKIDILVSAIGTGGTISGIAKKLKELKPDIKIIGVEPENSPLLTKGYSGIHKIQGIGANFIPKTLDLSLIDEIKTVSDDDAINLSKDLAKKEGILAGYSSGAALKTAIALSLDLKNKDKTIVVIFPDTAMRY